MGIKITIQCDNCKRQKTFKTLSKYFESGWGEGYNGFFCSNNCGLAKAILDRDKK